MRVMKQLRAAATALLLLAAAGCSNDGSPVNSPYESGAESRNTLYSAFVKRSPKYLDPASSYSNDETPYTYNVYETLYGYHYLKRPYELVPRAAASIDPPVYLDKQGNTLPADAPGEQIAQSVYDIKLRPGMRYAPHPAFAKKSDGSYAYFPVSAADLQDKYAIPDFPLTGTRDLTADDYVYAIRRLASPRVVSPIYSLMAEYVHGLKDYGDRLRLRDQALRRDAPAGRGLALAGLARGRWLRRRAGAGSADTAHPRQRQVSPVQVLAGDDLHGADPLGGRPLLQPARHGRAGPVVQYLARGHRPLHAGGVLAEPPPRAGAQPELPR